MIRFGTDGWRAILGQDFNLNNVRIVAQAVADYLLDEGIADQGIVIGRDTRELGEEAAGVCADVMLANGLKVFFCGQPVPTPVLSHAVVELQAAGGIMITASHNPPGWNGIKFKASYGGSGLPKIIATIERRLYKPPSLEESKPVKSIIEIDPRASFMVRLKSLVQLERIKNTPLTVIVDPMHGAASGYLPELLQGGQMTVVEIRSNADINFGGVNPEPIAKNLGALMQAVTNHQACAGFATDGDGDRVGAVDEQGRVVSAQYIYALLLKHLVENKGWRGGVVKTFSTTSVIDKLAGKYNLPVFETPIGFKYICELFLKEDILLGGEESGGIGFKNHIPERDGVLSVLLLLEMMAVDGKGLGQLQAELMDEVGLHCYDRIDLHLEEGLKEQAIDVLTNSPPRIFAGLVVKERLALDGFKFVLEDGSWILFRASGTEPVLRIYAEANNQQLVEGLLNSGKALVFGENP